MESAAVCYKKFIDYLCDHEALDEKVTHTRMGQTFGTSGRYHIGKAELKYFYEIYAGIIEHNIYSNLSEKQKRVGSLMTDYDFEFDGKHTRRAYTLKHITQIVSIMRDIILQYVQVCPEDLIAYVTEKKIPTIYRDCDSSAYDDKDIIESYPIKKVKDGFHICVIGSYSVEQRYLIYHKLKDELTRRKIFSDIPCTNTYETIIDIATIHRNNWTMYGSRKYIRQPYGQPYELTHIFNVNMEEENIDDYSVGDLINLFSVRRYGKSEHFENIDGTEEEYEEISKTYKLFNKSEREHISAVTSSTSPNSSSIIMPIIGSNSLDKMDDTLQIVRELIKLLSPERAKEYYSWIRVCWALHNINESLFGDFIEFSKKGGRSYDEAGCIRVWESSKKNNYTISALVQWAKADNESEYHRTMWDLCCDTSENALRRSATPVDTATLLKKLYGYVFKCASIDTRLHSGWYEFIGHRWENMEHAHSLRNELTSRVVAKYEKMTRGMMSKCCDDSNINIKELPNELNRLIKLCASLKETTFLNKVICECEYKFLDKTFFPKLNENRSIIGFNNGVFNLDTGEFRAGIPEDYITMTVGYDWIEYNDNDSIILEIMEQIRKIINNDELREYMMRKMASFAKGGNDEQQFVFWTGKGCHSPDTKILLFDGGYKCASDIRLNDVLMGDDSTPRYIRQIFSGVDDMYEITLSDGAQYKCNSEHRMAVKLIENETVICVNGMHIVNYYTLQNTLIEHVNTFNTLAQAHKFINYMKSNRKMNGYIDSRVAFPITVKEYVKLSDNTKSKLRQYRNTVNYPDSLVHENPYTIGYNATHAGVPDNFKYNSMHVRNALCRGILDKYGYDIKTSKLADDLKFIQCSMKNDMYKFTVKPIGTGKYYGFEITGNNRYLLENSIVTYNSNGKSLLVSLLKKTFGDYYKAVDPTVLTRKRTSSSNATPEMAEMKGVRIITVSEPEGDDTVFSSSMKKYSSGLDEINVRALYKNEITFVPQFKMIMICNDLPDIFGKDQGTWRRIRVVPFESSFVDGDPKGKLEFKKDPYMETKIGHWPPAFMWILLRKYYPKYARDGLGEPKCIAERTSDFKDSIDFYGDFIRGHIALTGNDRDRIHIGEVYGRFKTWYEHTGPTSAKCPARDAFIKYLTSSNIKFVKSRARLNGVKWIDSDENDIGDDE